MKKLTTLSVALAIVIGTTLTAQAQNNAKSRHFPGIIDHWKGKLPKHKEQVKYRVELRHPNGSIYRSNVYDSRQQAESQRARYGQYHWRKWKLSGIGEPVRMKGHFASYNSAQSYQIPVPFPQWIESQSVVRGSVSLREIKVKSNSQRSSARNKNQNSNSNQKFNRNKNNKRKYSNQRKFNSNVKESTNQRKNANQKNRKQNSKRSNNRSRNYRR